MVGVPSQLSVAVAVPVAGGRVLAVQLTVVFGGHVMTGTTLSTIWIVCTQEFILPQSSVAFQVLDIVLACGQLPLVVISVKVMVGVGSQLSVAEAIPPVLAGAVLVVQEMVTLTGQIMAGPALSSITTI